MMPSPSSEPDDRALVAALCRWFTRPGIARALPWRRQRTAWSALVAELMLQQTQAARVSERFPGFLARFPSPRVMASATEQEVLALWEGLGYYRRARHLHAAARIIATRHRGTVPRDMSLLRSLPGVGRYTAGAIASIVFNQPEPVVDGNVRRVLSRCHSHSDPASDHCAWSAATRLVHAAPQPGVFNEALMELGATICTPRKPRCDACPLSQRCAAYQQSRVHEFPRSISARRPSAVHHHSLIILRPGRGRGLLLVEQRPDEGMWAGMWQTPTIESNCALRPAELARRSPVPVTGLAKLVAFTHRTTHRLITFHVYRASCRAGGERRRRDRGRWCSPRVLARLPMSNPQRRIVGTALPHAGRAGSGFGGGSRSPRSRARSKPHQAR